MIRSTRDEVERYGHYSLAAESMYDHPFQWGSKRTGPDIARVGNKYSDEWHREHMIDPRAVVPESVMPGYPHLAENELKFNTIVNDLKANQMVGVPYTDDQVKFAAEDLQAQLDEDSDYYDAFIERYPTAQVRDFDGNPEKITEMDALIAYMQMLGTLVDFSLFNEKENNRQEDRMTHQEVANFAETWGLVFLFAMFAVAVTYALWPSNKSKFTKAAHNPLDEE